MQLTVTGYGTLLTPRPGFVWARANGVERRMCRLANRGHRMLLEGVRMGAVKVRLNSPRTSCCLAAGRSADRAEHRGGAAVDQRGRQRAREGDRVGVAAGAERVGCEVVVSIMQGGKALDHVVFLISSLLLPKWRATYQYLLRTSPLGKI